MEAKTNFFARISPHEFSLVDAKPKLGDVLFQSGEFFKHDGSHWVKIESFQQNNFKCTKPSVCKNNQNFSKNKLQLSDQKIKALMMAYVAGNHIAAAKKYDLKPLQVPLVLRKWLKDNSDTIAIAEITKHFSTKEVAAGYLERSDLSYINGLIELVRGN
jgi:hypothetical protein